MEISIGNCREILANKEKLSRKLFDELLVSKKNGAKRFSKTLCDLVYDTSVKKYRKAFETSPGEIKFVKNGKALFRCWLNGYNHNKNFFVKRRDLDTSSMTSTSSITPTSSITHASSSQMSIDEEPETEGVWMKRKIVELEDQLRLAKEHIDQQAKKTDLFKVERHSTRENGSGSCEKFGLKLTAVVHESLAQGISGSDLRRVLESLGNHLDLFGPDRRLPSESWITKCRLDLPIFNDRQIKSFVDDSEHLVLATDDTSLGQAKIASYGLHNHRGDYVTIKMMTTSATCGQQIADHLAKVIDDQQPEVRDMIRLKLKGVISDRGPAAEAGAKLFVRQFNQLQRAELPPIFVFPCTLHLVANGVSYMAKELSDDATQTMSRLRRVLGGRETGNYNKHSLCEAFKLFTDVTSPFESNLGCRYTHWPVNGQNLVDFEEKLVEILDKKKTLTTEQADLQSLMKSENWDTTLLECGALFAAYEHLLLPFDIAVKSSNTTVGQLKDAMQTLLTKMNVVEMDIGLDNLIKFIGKRPGDVGEALAKLLDRYNLPNPNRPDLTRRIQTKVNGYLKRAVARLRIKVVKDFNLMNEAIACGLSEDDIIPFHNRASERSFAVMKAINKRLGTLTKENCFALAIARQNRLGCFLSTLSDIGELTAEARSKRNDLLEKRRDRYNQLARERLAAEFDIVDFEE